jgi:predicted esterase
MTPEQKVALAATGWLLGSDQADTNLPIAMSLFKVRAIIERYLVEPVKNERAQLLTQLEGLEGSSPKLVAGIIAHMKPTLPSPDPSVATPGYYKLSVPIGLDNEPDARYLVQLPPQYDPLVRYPTIVTLNGGGTTPERQIDWWAGEQVETGKRNGQATRLGYIVVAVDWMKDGQREYEFSAREHAAVLGSLRDACRRFSIDTDRVFLTGHSLGGNAAWDIGLAHPDLWAGVMPIVAQCEKYCTLYWENAGLVPMYVVSGELDGDKTVANAPHLERYFNKGFDITLVEYRGRGHEDFHDDILNLFDWMNRRPSRNFFPKEFKVVTMRPWDNYFWWLEGGKFPPKGMIDPANWPPGRGVLPIHIAGKQLATNGLSISSSMGQVTIWLSPEAVDFDRPMKLTLNNTSLTKSRRIDPDLSVLLEDVRTRGDRQHPFWAKVEH